MTHRILSRSCLGLGGALAAVCAALTASPAMAANIQSAPSSCAMPPLSQMFLSDNDTGWYTRLPGETPGSFDGTGWNLRGGAHIATTQLAAGRTAHVLDLHGNSVATSPPVCVSSDFTNARSMIRALGRKHGVAVYVSGARTPLRYLGQIGGAGGGWTASNSIRLQPAIRGSWQRVRFTLAARGSGSEHQLYDFALDPRLAK